MAVDLRWSQIVNIVRDTSDIVVPKYLRAFGWYGVYVPSVKKIELKEEGGLYWYRIYFNRMEMEVPGVVSSSFRSNRQSDYLDLPKFKTADQAYAYLKRNFILSPWDNLPILDIREQNI